MHTQARYVWCVINRHASWGHQSSSEGFTFLPLLVTQPFSAICHPFSFSSLLPQKYCCPRLGWAQQHRDYARVDSLRSVQQLDIISFYAMVIHLLMTLPCKQPTNTHTQKETQSPCSIAQREGKGEASAPLATVQRLLWPSGELGQRGKSAESFLPPPKEKQLTKRVCLNSTEKLNMNKEEQDLSLDVTARGDRAYEPTPNSNFPVFSSSH